MNYFFESPTQEVHIFLVATVCEYGPLRNTLSVYFSLRILHKKQDKKNKTMNAVKFKIYLGY